MTARIAPRVSVVMPTYNVERYVGQAISSVLAQSEASLELIVVDDASTDATRDRVRAFHDDRLRLLAMERNGGQATARNRALSEARGEWVALIDADDWWAPERLERLLAAAAQANASMVADDCHLIEDGATRPWGSLMGMHGLHIEAPRLVGAAEFVRVDLGPTKPIIRRDVLTRNGITFDKTLHSVEDFAFSLECLLGGASFLVVPEAYYFYRGRRGATCSSDRVGVLREHAEVTERLAGDSRVRANGELWRALARVARRDRSGIPYYELVGLLEAGRMASAARVVLHSPDVLAVVARNLPIVVRARLSRPH